MEKVYKVVIISVCFLFIVQLNHGGDRIAVLFAAIPQNDEMVKSNTVLREADDTLFKEIPAPYCGIYSVFLAARSLDCNISFNQLVKSQYISSRLGSSLSDLELACKEIGLKGRVYSSFSCVDLKQTICPTILHVSLEPGALRYTHWVLYLGSENGQARILSVRHGKAIVELLEFADLASRWDGVCLMIDSKQGRISQSHGVYIINRSFFALLIFVFVASFKLFLKPRIQTQHRVSINAFLIRLYLQVTLVCFIALTIGFLYSLFMGYLFLGYDKAVLNVQDKHTVNFVPKLSIKEIEAVRTSSNISFVDARPRGDYLAGHLPKAIHIDPFSLSDYSIDLPKDQHIIVYCHSSGCGYSNSVLKHLKKQGYNNLSYYRGGWEEWRLYQQSLSK